MDASRRSILKMFGITAAAATTGVAVAKAAPLDLVPKTPPALQNPMAPGLLKPPDGMTYNWKRVFITQDDPDLENIARMVMYGWKPVPLSRHPEMPANPVSYWIEHGGLVLMEKPTMDIPAPVKFPEP